MQYNEFPYWTFGTESETKAIISLPMDGFEHKKIGSEKVIAIYLDNNLVMFVYPDMGNDFSRTAEIVIEPITIAEFDKLSVLKKVTKFLVDEFQKFSGNNLTRIDLVNDFADFKIRHEPDPPFSKLEIKMFVNELYIDNFYSTLLFNQISFGIPFNDFPDFFKPLLNVEDNVNWFSPNRHDKLCPSFCLNEKAAFNYLYCVLLKFDEIMTNASYNKNPDNVRAKNSWGIMPRTAPALVLSPFTSDSKAKIVNLIKENLLKLFEGRAAATQDFENTFNYIIMNKSVVGGHVNTIRDIRSPKKELMFVFEIRNPNIFIFKDYFL